MGLFKCISGQLVTLPVKVCIIQRPLIWQANRLYTPQYLR